VVPNGFLRSVGQCELIRVNKYAILEPSKSIDLVYFTHLGGIDGGLFRSVQTSVFRISNLPLWFEENLSNIWLLDICSTVIQYKISIGL
jgi:hypothetical protein